VEHKKIRKFLSELKKQDGDFIRESIFYMERYLEIKKAFHDFGFAKTPNTETKIYLRNNPDSQFYKTLSNILDTCLNEGTQASFLLAAMLTSMMKSRDEAIPLFEKSCNMKSDFIRKFALDLGAYTYSKPSGAFESYDGATFVQDSYNNSKFLILISLDSNFLRCYGPQLFVLANVLRDYHFHFHVVGKDVIKLIHQSLELINDIKRFREADSFNTSFSMQEVPRFVASVKTFYACARYIVAEQVMDYYKKDVYIMDADLYFEDDPSSFFESIGDASISFTITLGVRGIVPWRRFMAGNVYLRNNEETRRFLRHVVYYMNAYLHKEISWMLDQNALTYGYEVSNDVTFGTYKNRPTKQFPINSLFEKR